MRLIYRFHVQREAHVVDDSLAADFCVKPAASAVPLTIWCCLITVILFLEEGDATSSHSKDYNHSQLSALRFGV